MDNHNFFCVFSCPVAPEDGTGVPFLALLNAFVVLFNRGAAVSIMMES
jgi:hypothetical protein